MFRGRAPAGLVEALQRRGAAISASWRENMRTFACATSPGGNLFARYSEDPADVPRLDHEVAVRTVIGDRGVLRAPPVLDRGPGWMIERSVGGQPIAGAPTIDAVVAAVAEIPTLDLPAPEVASAGGQRLETLLRIARTSVRAVRVRDMRAARRELGRTDLPTVTCHRDFHPKNILIESTDVWVIDWEHSGPGPVGLDLMRLWTSLADADDRARVFDHAVELVGSRRRASLERLRFAVAVTVAVGMLVARDAFDRDDVAVARLLTLLPELRPR